MTLKLRVCPHFGYELFQITQGVPDVPLLRCLREHLGEVLRSDGGLVSKYCVWTNFFLLRPQGPRQLWFG